MLSETRLLHTRTAFDALAETYDRSEETNELLLRLRRQLWPLLLDLFPHGSRLLDLGCGTGIDAVYLAERGRQVVATDISPVMAARTRERAQRAGVGRLVEARPLAIESLDTLAGEQFDGIYADRGPLNCVAGLETTARDCASLLPPGGLLAATVIGRICPWEILYYLSHRQRRRATLRFQTGFVPVPLQGQEVPTRYFTPGEFSSAFARWFDVVHCRSLGLFLPPTYLAPLHARHRSLGSLAARLDDTLGALPVLRNAGDLFLMVLKRRG